MLHIAYMMLHSFEFAFLFKPNLIRLPAENLSGHASFAASGMHAVVSLILAWSA